MVSPFCYFSVHAQLRASQVDSNEDLKTSWFVSSKVKVPDFVLTRRIVVPRAER